LRHLDDQIRHPAAGRAITVTRDPQPDAMADLVRRLGHDGRVRHVRDPEYLAWRFKNPQREYRFLWAGGDQLEGYIVLAAGWEGVQSRINIVDWEGTDRQTRLALLRAAIAGGRFAEMDAWSLGLSEESSSMLRDAGFAPVSRRRLVRDGPVVLVRPVVRPPPPGGPRLGPLALLDQPNWDMRMLYSMSG
jgi:hypothetical protein